jgi:mono/diheme cytochrome c family protein
MNGSVAMALARIWKRLIGGAALLAIASVGPSRAQDAPFNWRQFGAQTYAGNCAACHQENGRGIEGAFPPLAGHAATLLARPGGRDYLAHLVLYGVTGEILADGKLYNGAMPPWGRILNDAQLAAALDYVLHSWGNEASLPAGTGPITAAEIAAARSKDTTAEQVYAMRQQMMPTEAPPVAAMVPPSFTAEQVERGRVAYRRSCQDCHGAHLNDGEFGGAPLNGNYFRNHWGNGSVAGLFLFMRTKMPPDRPGKLNPETYADLTAFLLAGNGYQPSAEELPAASEILARMSLKQ